MEFFRRKNKADKDQRQNREEKNYIWDYFQEISETKLSPYTQALDALKGVEESSRDKDEFIYFLTSDIIFTALHTTVMEEMFATIQNNSEYSIELISKFASDTQMRDDLTNDHTTNHLKYIVNNGDCEGCNSCNN